MVVKIYVEGGGNKKERKSKNLQKKCRKAFSKFLEKAGLKGQMPQVIACGPRREAYKGFRRTLQNPKSTDYPILLVDSEAPVKSFGKPWEHLRDREGDKWEKPEGATDKHAHLMVQFMESWFLADRECLESFYGQHFNWNALPQNPKIEEIPKEDIEHGLEDAIRPTKRKGGFSKGKHSFEILESLDPEKVCAASPHAKRFVDTLKIKTS